MATAPPLQTAAGVLGFSPSFPWFWVTGSEEGVPAGPGPRAQVRYYVAVFALLATREITSQGCPSHGNRYVQILGGETELGVTRG